MGPALALDAVTIAAPADRPLVQGLSLEVRPGELLALVGPSGCGKTLVLRAIAGLEDLKSGEIRLSDRRIDHLPPYQRGVPMVWQEFALFPHMTVRANVEFGLEMAHHPGAGRRARALEALDLVGLRGYEDRRPSQLSGGQKQRVALARALVINPPLLLLDEPLGSLDAKLRQSMQVELRRLHDELQIAMLYVTSSQDEALSIADRVGVLKDGRLLQVATPDEFEAAPANPWIARFVLGWNVLSGNVASDGTSAHTPIGQVKFSRAMQPGLAVALAIPPHKVFLKEVTESTDDEDGYRGSIVSAEYEGIIATYQLQVGESSLIEATSQFVGFRVGDAVGLRWEVGDVLVLLDSAGDPA